MMEASVKWQVMDIAKPPRLSGLYAVKHLKKWMYIGKAQCIATRIVSKRHPIQITAGLTLVKLSYFWCPVPLNELTRSENKQIRALDPEWNGGTTWDPVTDALGPCCQADYTISFDDMLAAIGGSSTP
jgi:hypothetical protein